MPVADPTVHHVPATRRLASGFLALALLFLQLAPVMATEITTDLWVYNYGDTVTVTGVDFGPDETVEIVTTDPFAAEVDRGTALTDGNGNFVYQFVLLSDVPGIYDVVATGLTSGLSAATQFDPPNFQTTFDAPTSGSPATADYSDFIQFTGTIACWDAGGGANNKCTTNPVEINIQLKFGAVWTEIAEFNQMVVFAPTAGTCLDSNDCVKTWTVNWQAGRYGATTVVPGTYSVRVGGTGIGGFLPSATGAADAVVITKEETESEYLGDTDAIEGTSLTLSADVDDFDHGSGAGNGEFSPDANLQSTVSATDGVKYQLWDAASCGGSSAAGPVYDDVNDAGSASGATLSLATVSAGTYYLKTTYLGNGFYSSSSDCDTVTVDPADTTGPTITISSSAGIDGGTGWYNINSSGTGGIDVDVSASDASGVDTFNCSVDGGSSSPYDPTGDVIHLGDGQHTIYCEAEDTVGNPSNATESFDVDQTAPSVSVALDRSPDAGTGWFNASTGAPTAEFTCSDGTSGILSCPADYPFGEGENQSHSGTAYDNAGNSASATVSDVDVDTVDPYDVTVAADRAPDSNGWYNHSFTATWSGVDDTSGIDSCTETTYTGPDTASGQLNGTCTDEAGNTSAPPVAFNFMYDATDPSVAVTFPLAGGSYNAFTWNAGCGTAFSGDFCGTGSDALSGLDTVEYSVKRVSNGLYWNGTGFVSSDEVLLTPSGLASWAQSFAYSNFPATDDYTIRAVATDEAANDDDVMVSFTINNPGGPYDFEGFFSPVDNPPAVNEAKAGQGIPVKWRITEAGAPVSDPNSFVALTSRQVTCADLSTLGVDLIEIYAGSSGLQYMGDGNWQFNWKTPKSYAGQCRIMTLTLNDGSTHDAYFRFK